MKIKSSVLFVLMFACSMYNTACAGGSENNSDGAANAPIHLTKADFLKLVVNYETNPEEWIYLGDKPCLIDFYANWCGPCRRLAPVLDELAKEYAGQIYIYKINTDEQKELAGLFRIRSIPTLLFVPMKGQPQMVQGALPKDQLQETINKVLLNK